MEQFGNLTLDDEFIQKVHDDELTEISRLTISDNTLNVSPQVMSRYMPHFPVLPSPLRNSFSFVEGDQMDIDDCEDSISFQDDQSAFKPSETDKRTPRVTFAMPDVRLGREPKRKSPKEEVEEVEENDSESEEPIEERQDSTSSTAVIRALLSPTSLGVAAATKIDGIPLEESVPQSRAEQPSADDSIEFVDGKQSRDIQLDSIKQELRSRSRTQPIHVSINNHHHYYPASKPHSAAVDPQMAYHPEDVRTAYPLIHEDGRYKLPVPWSADSHPSSRGSYAFMSYLQLFLNALTVTAIFSVVTSFFRTLKTDIKSTWEHRRLELAYESSRCQVQYLANKCSLGGRPALQAQCQVWEQCMNRDNDIFFRARSTLSAKLFGEIINSFIEPIGWKALLVIWIGIIVWVFCSNFLLGFARAKSYYGEPSHRIKTLASPMGSQIPLRQQHFLEQDGERIAQGAQNTLIDLPRAQR